MMGDHRLIVNTLLCSPLPPRPPSSVTVAKVSITKFLNLIDSKQPYVIFIVTPKLPDYQEFVFRLVKSDS